MNNVASSKLSATLADNDTLQIRSHHDNQLRDGGVVSVATHGEVTSLKEMINVYSFALKPEEHQPSGTCNFSRIDNAQLVFSASTGVDKVYAVNYNVLRIMSGMGGLAYSN